jgi:hypothetical protein
VSEAIEPRIGVTERERAMQVLTHHVGTGTLSLTEFDERSALAAAATTRSELARVLVDLPIPVSVPREAPARPMMGAVVTGSAIVIAVAVLTWATGEQPWLCLLPLAAAPAVLHVLRRR